MADAMSKLGTSQTGGTSEQVKEKTDQVKQVAGEQLAGAKEKVGDQVRSQVQQRTGQVAEQARSVSQSVRSVADDLESKGSAPVANVVRQVADRGEQLADYFQNADADTLLRDVESQARQRPWVVVAGAFTLGLAASRLLKASSQNRHTQQQSGPSPQYRQLETSSTYSVPSSGSLDINTGYEPVDVAPGLGSGVGSTGLPGEPQRGAW